MYLGIDTSTYFEEIDAGTKYILDGKEIDPLKYLHNVNGVTCMRIRLWVDPFGENKEPYLAGTCDLNNFIKLAKLAMSYGYEILLDIHYSDFWADPGKQLCPKSWVGLTFEEIKDKVYEYTKEVLVTIKKEGIPLKLIQIGNEITNGMIWPYGRLDESVSPRGNYDKLSELLKAGIKATREENPETKIIIHLERSYDHPVYDEYFTNIIKYGVDFDIIGASYYPYWHGTFDQLFDNLKKCQSKFNKEIMIMELGYSFTLEDYIKSGSQAQLVINSDNIDTLLKQLPQPITPEGQAKFVKEFLVRAEKEGVSAVFYWEPLWIPGENICWASKVAQKYIHEEGKSTRNEWANQCLFNYEGVALPSLDEFSIKNIKGDK